MAWISAQLVRDGHRPHWSDHERNVCCIYSFRDYLAEPNDKYWGPNLLDTDAKINPGDSITITGISPATYDIHAETCSGNYTWDWSAIDLTSDAEVNMNN